MKISKHIAIDIDDTLAPFTPLAKKILADWDGTEEENRIAKNAAYSPWVQWRSLSDLCPFYQKVIDKAHEPDQILANEPIEDSVKVLNELAEAGHRLTYITARAENRYGATKLWLRHNNFPLDKVTGLVCTYEDKLPYIKECQYLIDDRPKTLVSFVYDNKWYGEQRKGFGLMTQANQSLTDIPNVYLSPSWSLLRHYFKEKGGLLND